MSLPDAGPVAMVDTGVDEQIPAEEPGGSKVFDPLLRIAGGVLAVLATVLSAVLELFLAPLRLGGILVGVAVVLAVVANAAIGWFAVYTVGRRWALAPVWGLWTVLMFFGVGMRTDEGDYLVSADNWVGLVTVLAGSLTFASYGYRLILRGNAPR